MNLAQFRKPSRYIGNEVNMVRREAEIKVALCFPDTYEIGMSHTGLKILYSIINNIPYASAERAYAPWTDLESYLRDNHLPLASLENRRPLKDFDIVGFTLQYELSYTNVLNMLDLGGIPVKAEERNDEHPVIIAGGPCAVNPLPLAPFIDAFVIGDGEEVIGEIIEEGKRRKAEGGSKEKILNKLAQLQGVYVPSVHDSIKQKIKRRIIEDLDKAPFPDAPLVPHAQAVHDRVAIEIARGCARGCRFCQAGMIYRPFRERAPETVLSLARKSVSSTGFEEVSFTSLNTGDYSCLLPVVREFNKIFSGSYVSISLPSLRVGSVDSDVLKEIKSVRQTGFTIAPEAGTKRLRDVVNKNFTDEEYEETLRQLFKEGWKSIKLYFMIGLPTETMADIDGLIDMAVKALKRGREITGRRVTVNVGISAFVPKPHTPFQWAGQEPLKVLREKQDYLRKAFTRRGVNFKGQHVETSMMEAVFARGGRECASLLYEAWISGCRFDGWSELFVFDKWLLAAERTGINLHDYATRKIDTDKELPWDFIDTGITKKFLESEYNRSLQQETTPDCQHGCSGCGLECKNRTQNTEHGTKTEDKKTGRWEVEKKNILNFSTSQPPNLQIYSRIKVPSRLRVRFSKTGEMRYLSHQELITAMLRALRRGGIPLSYTTGFHPHPKIAFGPALPVGVEGLSEYFDIELAALMDVSNFVKILNKNLPEGLEVRDALLISHDERSLNDLISRYEYEVTVDRETEKEINSFMSEKERLIQRDTGMVDIRPMVEHAEITGNTLHLMLLDKGNTKVRILEILKELLQKPVEEIQTASVKRVRLYGYNRTDWIEPIND